MTPPLLFLAILTLILIGLMAFFMSFIENKSFFEAFYFAIVTFSTVGLGDVVPTSTLGKLR
jgi:voltage-gated potassium channel